MHWVNLLEYQIMTFCPFRSENIKAGYKAINNTRSYLTVNN